MTTRGGKRAGSGRPRKSKLGAREVLSLSLCPEIAALLRQYAAEQNSTPSALVTQWIGIATDY
jgi:hypothetical protein